MIASVGVTVIEKGSIKNTPVWDLKKDQDGNLSMEDFLNFIKNSRNAIARVALSEEQDNGFDRDPVTIVDGKFTKNLDSGSPLGRVEFVSRADLKDVVLFAYSEVLKYSPVDQGRYLGNNIVTLNGKYIADNPMELSSWFEKGQAVSDKDVFRLINISPYARKLERYGITRFKGGSKKTKLSYAARRKGIKRKQDAKKKDLIRVPNGTYALASKNIKAKYGKNSFITFRLVPGNKLGITPDMNGNDGVYKRGHGSGRYYFYPTILISVVGEGLTKEGIAST